MFTYQKPHANLTITFTQPVPMSYVIECAKRMKDIEPTLDFKAEPASKTIFCRVKGENFAYAPLFEPPHEPFKYDSLLSFITYLTRTFKIIEITGHICFLEDMKCSSIKQTFTDTLFYNTLPDNVEKDGVLTWLKAHDLRRCEPYIYQYITAGEAS